jgi:tellurite resistance protein TerC
MSESWIEFIAFNALIIVLLFIDLGVFQKKSHEIKMKEALLMSGGWILLSLIFNAYVLFAHGGQKALEFFTGYIVEKSLSVDNLFVFLILFRFFSVPARHQQKVLFWGIAVAMVLRGIFIFAGIGLIEHFHYLIYIFGAFLIYTGVKIYLQKDKKSNPADSWFTRAVSKTLPFSGGYNGARFTTVENGKKKFTQLFLVFIVLNVVDVVFAFDSIPAIFAITLDPFIVYTSNIFAILGLRALYFVLSGAADSFYYIHHAIAVILCFVGAKMLLADRFVIHPALSLLIIAIVLTWAIIASVIKNRKEHI